MKYDIIYTDDAARWQSELSYGVYDTIMSFLKEFAEEYNKKPEVESLVLGLDTWNWLSLHPQYCHLRDSLKMYNIWIRMPDPDWTVNTRYIELNLV